MLSATKSDKKMVGNQVKFILLHTIGDAYIYRELSDAQILDGIQMCIRDRLWSLYIGIGLVLNVGLQPKKY